MRFQKISDTCGYAIAAVKDVIEVEERASAAIGVVGVIPLKCAVVAKAVSNMLGSAVIRAEDRAIRLHIPIWIARASSKIMT